MNDVEELEFIVREYEVVTERLIEVMGRLGDEEIPLSIRVSLMALANSINNEW
jgi:hypothetical protein